jgi:hypothetical protein
LTAHLPDTLLAEVLNTDSVQDVAIKSQLNELRTTGQMIDRGGIEADVVSVSRIIRGCNNEVVGALEVLIPQYRAKLDAINGQIEEAAQALSAALGAGTVSGSIATIEKEVVGQPAAGASQPGVLAGGQQSGAGIRGAKI